MESRAGKTVNVEGPGLVNGEDMSEPLGKYLQKKIFGPENGVSVRKKLRITPPNFLGVRRGREEAFKISGKSAMPDSRCGLPQRVDGNQQKRQPNRNSDNEEGPAKRT